MKLINHKLETGNCIVGRSHPDKSLNEWVVKQRTHRRKDLLTTEQIKKLDLIGFDWKKTKLLSDFEIWKTGYDKFKLFIQENGNINPTKTNAEFTLVTWVIQQRHRRRKNNLKQEYIDLLDELNFNWNPERFTTRFVQDDTKWMKRYEELIAYKAKFHTTNVSQTHKEYYSLARWVLDQRIDFRKGEISDFRKQKLDEVEFIWDARKQKANSHLLTK